MRLKTNFVVDVYRILHGRLPPYSVVAQQVDQLESVEEFLGWIVLRQDLEEIEPEIANQITEQARMRGCKAETPRKEAGFLLERRHALEELHNALISLIQSDGVGDADQVNVHKAMVRYAASSDEMAELTRFNLGLEL